MRGRKKYALIAAACVVVIGAALLIYGALGRKPFRDLEPGEIVTASVTLTPPDVTLAVEDTGTLSRLLGDLVVYRDAGDSCRDYAGQGVKYTLTLADGTVTEVTAFNPFLIIDGTAYKTKYAPVVVASCISFAPG